MRKGITFGAMDLCHAGHCIFLKECRENCDYLVVGLHTDPSNERPNKNKPILTVEERLIILNSLKYVDEVIVYHYEADCAKLMEQCKADVRFIGSDWKGKPFAGYEYPIKVIYHNRNHGYSSTELRERIKKS